MTRRPKVWEPRGEGKQEEEPEWSVRWNIGGLWIVYKRAPHAFAAHQKVKGAPAFGSCRVRRIDAQDQVSNTGR